MNRPPLCNGRHMFSSLFDLQRDPTGLFINAHKGIGGIVRLRFGPHQPYYITNPEYIRYIFQTNAGNYYKSSRGYFLLRKLLGNGPLTANGTLWKEQRMVGQEELRRQNIEGMQPLMRATLLDMAGRWENYARAKKSFDIYAEMARLAINIVDKTMMKMDFDSEIDPIRHALNFYYQEVYYRMTHIFNIPFFVPTPQNRRLKAALLYLQKIVDRIIEKHRPLGRESIIVRLANLDGQGPKHLQSLQDQRDAIMAYLIAGHESTANALTWMWYLLALHPEVEQRNYEEINRVLGGHEPTIEKLSELKYADQIILETMRLYPPVWNNSRVCMSQDQIGGFPIPPKTLLIVSAYAMHRMPEYWDDPERFDPDRFEQQKLRTIDPCVYFPFGIGPRICVGKSFALQEMKLTLVMIAQRFRLKLTCPEEIRPKMLISLPPAKPVMVDLIRRKDYTGSSLVTL